MLPDRLAALRLVPNILINNAGVTARALVAKSIPEQQLNVVEVDVAAVVDLCSRFVPGMVERGCGAVLNVSSLAGLGPSPEHAAYGAAKAFVLCYTESLRCELRGTGVTATALCSGPVATGFVDKGGFTKAEVEAMLPRALWKSAETVALAGINGLAAGKGVVTPGQINRIAAALLRVLPHEPMLPMIARRSPLMKELALQRGSSSGR
jgi:short-subunit dehydrogenase